MQLLLSSAQATKAFEGFIQLLRTSKLTPAAYDVMVIAKPTPLIKGVKGKLRPIVCGNQFRKVAMSALSKENANKFKEHLREEQYAVGVPAAIEKMSHTMKAFRDEYPEKMLIQIDAVSAFNYADRLTMLQEMERAYP